MSSLQARASGLTISPSSTMYMIPGGTCSFTTTSKTTDCNGVNYYSGVTGASTWSSTNTSVCVVSGGVATAQAAGSATITATYKGTTYTPTGCGPSGCTGCSSSTITEGASCPVNVDSLVFAITSGGVSVDANGVVAKSPFNLKMQAKSPSGAVPDPNFNAQNVPFTLISQNASVGESAPSTVNFSSGSSNASVTIVRASGLTNSTRQIVVSANATGTVFFPLDYMNVIATREGLVGQTTACGHVIATNDHFVALPYGTALCGQAVHLAYGQSQQDTSVQDVGPWCPHSSSTSDNPCVCSADAYWLGTATPYAATNSCSSNGAGIDLADGTFYGLGLSTNAPIDWKFP